MPSETVPAHCSKNVARFLEMSGCDAEPAYRDKRVASPIAEPRITRDKGFSFAALDEISVGGTFERTGEILPAGCSIVLTWA